MSGALKVLHVIYEYPPVGGGGGEVCRNLVEFAARHGVDNTVLTSRVRGLDRLEVGENLRVRRIFCCRRRTYQCSIPEMFCNLLASIPWAFLCQARTRFDLVHVHFAVPSGPVGYLLNRCFGLRYIMTLHGGDVPSFVPEQTAAAFRLVRPLTVPVWRRAARIVAVSPSLARMAARDYPGVRVECIVNGVDRDFFLAGEKDFRAGRLNVVFFGRLAVQKQVHVLLRALAALAGEPGWRADIVGDGPLAADLRALAGELGLGARVRFHGWLERERLLEVLARAHVFVLPSLKEGLPLSAVQAMAAGLALLGSDVPGVRDVVRDGDNGRLFPCGDAESLAAHLRALIADRERLRRFSARSRALAAEYDWERIGRRYLDLYREVRGAGPGARAGTCGPV